MDFIPRWKHLPINFRLGCESRMICTRCQGTGFLNVQQLPEELLEGTVEAAFEYLSSSIKYKQIAQDDWYDLVLVWINVNKDHDVSVCDCCGDGEGWYGGPGHHNRSEYGKDGPYASNGGRPKCY